MRYGVVCVCVSVALRFFDDLSRHIIFIQLESKGGRRNVGARHTHTTEIQVVFSGKHKYYALL